MKRFFKRLHTAQTRGQSLVEMAIIAPILIFFLLGIFEVGWALRNYLVLINVNREITRFAIRPGYMDFSNEAAREASYAEVVSRTVSSASDQIALDFADQSTLIISHMVVDTGLPCEDMSNGHCNCDWFDPESPAYKNPDPSSPSYDPDIPFTLDDIIIQPDLPNYAYQAYTYGITETVTGEERTSRIDYNYWTARLTDENNKFNCEVINKGGLPSANNMVFTELFHDQPQLFGFPIISNPLTDPVPLYTHTVMRLISGARATGGPGGSLIAGIDTIGEVCFAHPFIVSKIQLDDKEPLVPGTTVIDILDGADVLGGGSAQHKGWVVWQAGEDEDYLTYELRFPQMSVNSYEEPGGLGDTVLNEGDVVASLEGAHMSATVQQLIENLAGHDIIVPVWDQFTGTGYRVSRFIQVSINGAPNVAGPDVEATYLGEAPLACDAPEAP